MTRWKHRMKSPWIARYRRPTGKPVDIHIRPIVNAVCDQLPTGMRVQVIISHAFPCCLEVHVLEPVPELWSLDGHAHA